MNVAEVEGANFSHALMAKANKNFFKIFAGAPINRRWICFVWGAQAASLSFSAALPKSSSKAPWRSALLNVARSSASCRRLQGDSLYSPDVSAVQPIHRHATAEVQALAEVSLSG